MMQPFASPKLGLKFFIWRTNLHLGLPDQVLPISSIGVILEPGGRFDSVLYSEVAVIFPFMTSRSKTQFCLFATFCS